MLRHSEYSCLFQRIRVIKNRVLTLAHGSVSLRNNAKTVTGANPKGLEGIS